MADPGGAVPTAAVPDAPAGTIFISDDDDDLDLPDEWLAAEDPVPNDDFLRHAGHIQLQLRICYGLLCALPLLAILLALSWRKYGAIITQAQAEDTAARKARASSSSQKKDT